MEIKYRKLKVQGLLTCRFKIIYFAHRVFIILWKASVCLNFKKVINFKENVEIILLTAKFSIYHFLFQFSNKLLLGKENSIYLRKFFKLKINFLLKVNGLV